MTFNAIGGNVGSGLYISGPLGDATPEMIERARIIKAAEKQGRIDGAKANAFDRIKYLANAGVGIADSYKVERIKQIIIDLEADLERIEAEYIL